MIDQQTYQVFKQGSTTYFLSSLFFPENIKQDVFALYAFVRVADDFVDQVPQQTQALQDFYETYQKALKRKTGNPIIDNFVILQKKHQIPKKDVESFFKSMFQDCTKSKYQTMQQFEDYIYGSAEVIGLMMAKVLQLPKASYPSAKLLGKSMQFANFIRDIEVDNKLGRTYFPAEELEKFTLNNLSIKEASAKPVKFNDFMQAQIKTYQDWQQKAELGFQYIPPRLLIPVKTASDMYKFTVRKIQKEPTMVYRKQFKPSKTRVVLTAVLNSISLYSSLSRLNQS